MPASTTIRVTPATRDAIRSLAEHDGSTHEEVVARLVRMERQRRMGDELANEPGSDDAAWIAANAEVAGDHAGR